MISKTVCVAALFTLVVTANLAQADHNRLLQTEYRRAISRHLACDKAGFVYLVAPSGPQGFTLRVSAKPHPKSSAHFTRSVPLPLSFANGTSAIFSAGLAVDPKDRLHLVLSTSTGKTVYTVVNTESLRTKADKPNWLNPVSEKPGFHVIASRNSWIGDVGTSSEGRIWLAWTIGMPNEANVTAHLGSASNGAWSAKAVGRGKNLYPPSLLINNNGTFHLTCSDVRGFTQSVTGSLNDLHANKKWELTRSHSGNRPALAMTPDNVLAVHESGDSLKYTLLGSEPVRTHPLTDSDSRLVWDTVHSPQMLVDHHGIPWVFFIDSTRQTIFYSRWLGTAWSPMMNGFWLTRNTARFEDNHLAIDYLAAQNGLGSDKTSLGLVIGNRSHYPATAFHRLEVPSLKSAPGKKVLFLDLKELKQIEGVQLKVNTARKHAQPVLRGGHAGEFDSQGAANIAVVKSDRIYKAWYSGLHREPGSEWPKSGAIPYVRVGYAESADGIHFNKKPLGLSSFGKSDRTNIVSGLPATPIFRPIVPTGMHIDSSDPNPSRRYKFLTWTAGRPPNSNDRNDSTGVVDKQTWTLWTSPDGLRWRETSRGGIKYPAGMPSSFSPQSMFHDQHEQDPSRKYKAYGFIGLNNDRRGAGYGYSSDGIEWTAHASNPIFDPWARATPVVRNGKVEQIHDAVVWKYHQYYLALYQYQRSGEEMTIELAMSRDGENFTYIQPGAEVVRRGAAGEWDSDSISPSVPLIDDNQIKVYYSGYRFSKTKFIEGERSCGLAILRLDGFTQMTLANGQEKGSVTTIPIDRGSATDLLVNSICGTGSRIEVELVAPLTGKALPGFTRHECSPITTDSLAHRVTWSGKTLADVRAQQFQIRFILKRGRTAPELFSFEFADTGRRN